MNTKESKNLYFIRLIQKAYESDDKQTALKKVFDEINSMATIPEYETTFKNSKLFIKSIESALAKNASIKKSAKYSNFYELVIDILLNEFGGDEKEKQEIIDYFSNDPEFNEAKKVIKDMATIGSLSVEVLRNGKLIKSQPYTDDIEAITISGISPGEYIIQLSNGRRLWSYEIGEKQVVWKSAYPKKEFPAAAKTEPTKLLSTMSESLMGGEIKLDIFPGIESGTIRINISKPTKI